MFQYAASILGALSGLNRSAFDIEVLYTRALWRPYIERHGLKYKLVNRRQVTNALSLAMLALGLPAGLCRRLSKVLVPAVRSMLREERDLWIFPAQDLLAYQAPVAALVSVHDLMHRYERFPEISAFGRYTLRERRFGGIAASACGVLVDSETGKHQLVEAYGIEASRVHPLPYVPAHYIFGATPPGFDERHRLPAKYAFYPAQFWEHKNHRRLLEALAALRAELPDLHLVLSGSRTHGYASLARLCRELGLEANVSFVGRIADADMPELYRRARCLVMPTFFGPTNIPPLEAFALGCPVAVSGIYGMPEQVGDAALTFDPRSAGAIAEALRRLWSDDALCAELRSRGLQHAARWNQAAFNRRFSDILELVLRQRGLQARG